MEKGKKEQSPKKPLPNHMDKSMFFDSRSTGGRENANDIKKFPATSRRIPLAKNEEHFKKQIQIESKTKDKLDQLKKNEAKKKWITNKSIEAEVKKQKEKEDKAWKERREKALAKGKAASKEAYSKSPDSLKTKFNQEKGKGKTRADFNKTK